MEVGLGEGVGVVVVGQCRAWVWEQPAAQALSGVQNSNRVLKIFIVWLVGLHALLLKMLYVL